MNLNIVDPGLYCASGHHLEWNLRLVRELAARGHRISIFAHRQVDSATAALLRNYAKVVPQFRVSPYLIPQLFDQQTDFGSQVFEPVAGQMVHFLDGAKHLAEDMTTIEPGDLNIWPSLAASQFYAQTLVPWKATNLACIHQEPYFAASAGAMLWRYAELKARQTGLDIHLGVTTQELQHEYESVLPTQRIRLWPICVDGRTPPMPRQSIRRIGFFGHQRVEKGAQILQELVPLLLSAGWQVVVHDSGHLIRGNSGGNLILLGYVENIVSEIEKCDLIVVPYDPAAYRSRGSSIVWEAIACGVPVVVPRNSAPGRFAISLGAGIGLLTLAADEIRSAIFAAAENYKSISESAFLASRNWASSHGSRRYVDALLSTA